MTFSSEPSPDTRILVVDDEPSIRHMLLTALADAGYAVREAANGITALDAARSWRPDAIILDLMMPVMNGWQFAEAYGELAGSGAGLRAPVIVLTAAGPGAIRSTASLGVISAVLAKPVNLDELSQTLTLHLAEPNRP
jgi:two-component system, OmpR family, response regulator MprA